MRTHSIVWEHILQHENTFYSKRTQWDWATNGSGAERLVTRGLVYAEEVVRGGVYCIVRWESRFEYRYKEKCVLILKNVFWESRFEYRYKESKRHMTSWDAMYSKAAASSRTRSRTTLLCPRPPHIHTHAPPPARRRPYTHMCSYTIECVLIL